HGEAAIISEPTRRKNLVSGCLSTARRRKLCVTAARFSFSIITKGTAFRSAPGAPELQPQRAAHNLERLAKSRLEEADVMRGDVALEIRKEREARRRVADLRDVHQVEALALHHRRIHRRARTGEDLVE